MDYAPILSAIIDIASAAAAAIAPVIATQIVLWLHSRHKVELTAAQEQRISQAVREGVDFAEQWARKRLKARSEAPSGDEKLAMARAHASRSGADTASGERLEEMIEAELGRRNSLPPPPPSSPTNGLSGR